MTMKTIYFFLEINYVIKTDTHLLREAAVAKTADLHWLN